MEREDPFTGVFFVSGSSVFNTKGHKVNEGKPREMGAFSSLERSYTFLFLDSFPLIVREPSFRDTHVEKVMKHYGRSFHEFKTFM